MGRVFIDIAMACGLSFYWGFPNQNMLAYALDIV